MRIDTLLSTIILVSFLVTILMAVGSYAAYKLREARRPHAEAPPPNDESLYFERVVVNDS
jgi:hypothetical protein